MFYKGKKAENHSQNNDSISRLNKGTEFSIEVEEQGENDQELKPLMSRDQLDDKRKQLYTSEGSRRQKG